ncbi:MAG: rRNA maturation RNase YbeY [Chthoniobacterales bacterium]
MNKAIVITVRNAQRAVPVQTKPLQEFATRALREVLRLPAKPGGVLRDLAAVTIVLVSDRRIAAVHQQFMNLPGATDVITFEEGDILISAQTAQANARRFQNSLGRELRLYLVHGLLHLHGFDEATPAKSRAMQTTQERILARLAVR